jgi:hypothetical protein
MDTSEKNYLAGTTLASTLYNHTRICLFFDLNIFVYGTRVRVVN